ncbi:MAG: glutaredoxin 3 [Gammaproteobacteria bacterium]|jgi:glutaredoxin 3|nr:glutaredoxin 3 [Gammaproteobacteria bacterium]|tara:strand:+ start:206 stop:463 length:258 start_codon:yes stop_codon:yes gene_type:complete
MSEKVFIYSTRFCPFCLRAKSLLTSKGVEYTDIAVDRDMEKRKEMMKKSKQFTVPQIWIGDKHVGGCDELYALERKGRLDALLGV